MVVEPLDLFPKTAQLKDLAHDRVGAGDLGGRQAGAGRHLVDTRTAGPMYEVGGRKLGYLHPMETALSGTFILTETEERELAVTDGLRRASREAIRDGRVASGVRWCWMEFPDLDTVDAFVDVIRLKHQLLARPD